MRHIYYIIAFLLCFAAWQPEAAAQGYARIPDSTQWRPSVLSKDSLLIGDQVIWTMSVKAEAGAGMQLATELSKEVVPGVELLEAIIDTIKSKRGKEWILNGRLRLTSFDSGSYKLPPMPYYVLHPSGRLDTLWFEGPSLEVTTIPIDTTTYQPFDIKGAMNYPITAKELMPWGGLLLFLLLTAYLLYRWWRHRKDNRPLFGKPKPKEPSYLVAFRQLEEIRAQKLWESGKVKVFYTAVTDVLRIYMSARWGFQAMEQTSAELMASLKEHKLDKPLMQELHSLLLLADLVKFAKYEPQTAENEDILPQAVKFVQTTMIEETPEMSEMSEASETPGALEAVVPQEEHEKESDNEPKTEA